MSSANASRKRAQKHQNSFAYKPGLYGLTPQQKAIQQHRIDGVCTRCKDILEWKIKYNKYKILTVPARCTKCGDKNVKKAYHNMCSDCADSANLCPKCGKASPSNTDSPNSSCE